MLRIIAIWVINALALLALPYAFSSIHVESFGTALVVALVLGLINTLLRPLLVLLTLPVTLLTLGLFILVINALLFQLTGHLVSGFDVGGFWSALFGSIGYSVISWALHALLFKAD
ncbi:MAG: phage holin family protein [Dechloromonas sp.]|nr:phage holin family protein [Dechloromonas sp.]